MAYDEYRPDYRLELRAGEKLAAFDVNGVLTDGDFTVESAGRDWVVARRSDGACFFFSSGNWMAGHEDQLHRLLSRWRKGRDHAG